MIFFITFLRAISACLITNAHYTGIYPTDLIANGGLIGDVLFFAISGYCLVNVKMSFPRWYSKRIVRCYLPVLIMTAIYMLLGFYSLRVYNLTWWFVYPTFYHFVASIVVLYIPYYIILKIDVLKKNIPLIMAGIAVVYTAIYFIFYDKSYYHIDYVREPMIRFLFMECMLLGAHFRLNDDKYRDKLHWYIPVASVVFCVLYFASKLVFAKKAELAPLQIINQFLIFALLYFVFRLVMSIDGKLTKLPSVVKKLVSFVAKVTLEIYVVQYVIIENVRGKLPFPVNWLVLTASILAVATILHYVCEGVFKLSYAIIDKVKNSSEKVTK